MQNTQVIAINQIYRHLFTSSIQRSSASRQSRIMEKLIHKDQGKRGQFDVLGLKGSSKPQLSIHTQRRMAVLNKVFMQHITSMMSMGEVEPALLEKDIEISDVKVTADFKQINVYWIENSADTSNTEKLLRDCASELRYRLTELRVIGFVPPIQFVKFRHNNILKEVERRLAIADYGEDHVPNTYPHAENCTVMSRNAAEKSEDVSENDDTFTVILPVMKHNVFGLDHERIMSKIKLSLTKSRQGLKERMERSEADSVPAAEFKAQGIPEFMTAKEQKEQFTKFLAQRRKEQRLKYKRSKEVDIHNMYNFNGDDCKSDVEDDYFSEDEYKH